MRSAIPRLITFDVTGTLLTTSIAQHYAAAAANEGLGKLDDSKLEKSFIDSYKRLDAEHPIYGKNTGLGWQKWWRRVVHDVVKDQREDVRQDKLDKMADSLIACYSTSQCWHLCPGALEILNNLSKRRVVLGVISNFDDRLDAVLDSTKIRSYFDFVLTSYTFGKAKPNPDIFQEALRLASERVEESVKPHEAVHIGDCPKKDYAGARAACWRAILMNRGKNLIDDKEIKTGDVFTNFKDLMAHFEHIPEKSADVPR